VHQGRVGLAERQPRPGEPAERRAVAQRLLRHPQQGDDDGPHPWRSGQRRCALEQSGRPPDQADVERLEDGKRQPRRLADVDPRPGEHRQEERQPGDQAEQQPAAGGDVAGGEGEQADPDRGQRPQVMGGKGEPQRDAGGQREDQAGAHRFRLCHPGNGSGPACRWVQPRLDRMPIRSCCLLSTRAPPSAARTSYGVITGEVVPRIWLTRWLRAQAALGTRTDPFPRDRRSAASVAADPAEPTGSWVCVKPNRRRAHQ
jgi:hypothetical protein